MNHNYHRRLSNYMSEPRLNYRYSSPDHTTYINAVKSKYITNDKPVNFGMSPNYYPAVLNQPTTYCQQCNVEKERASQACTHLRTQSYKGLRKGRVSDCYFGPEIKTIQNTLMDIRDQMKSRNNKKQIGRVSHQEVKYNQNYENCQSQYIKAKQIELRRKIQQSERLNKQLQIKVDELEHHLADYQRKNRLLEEDKNVLQRKIAEFQKEIQELRRRANRIEAQKNKSDEQQRGLQIKIMEMRAELMRKQQIIRDLNFEGEHRKHMQATKRLMMGPSDQVSVLVNYGISQVKYSKEVQTVLTEVDIEAGYRQLNKMQDHLCDRINGNLKVEKKIFAHLENLDERLNQAYERIRRVQQQGLKMGIVII